MSGSIFVLPANRAALVIRGSGFETLAALNGHGDPWSADIRSILISSAQRRGTINDVPHLWIALQVAPPINEQITPAPGIEILPAGGEILLPDDTAREWTQALKTGKSIQAAPIKKSSLEDFARWVHDRVAANDPPCEPPPAEHEAADPRPIIDDDAIDSADAHTIVSALRMNGIDASEDLEALPRSALRDTAKRLTRSPAAWAAAEALRDEDRQAQKKRDETDAYYRFAIRSDKGVRLDNAAVGAFVRDRLHTITFNGTVYLYDDGSGLYREDAGQINGLIQRIAETVAFNGSITSAKREILSYVRDHNVAGEYPFNRHPNALPLANGVLEIDWATGRATLHPYTPGYRFTQRWPVVYDDKEDPTPMIEILREYVDDEAVPALLQLPAQAVLHFCGFGPFKRSYIFEGPSNGGKSTFLVDLLNRIFGAENISGASLQAIGRDRFVTATIESAVINRCDDLSDVPLENVGPFKALTGGFSHAIERKYQNPYPGRVTAVHAFSTNAPPTVPDNVLFDAAFWNRWIYLRFNNVFEVDPSFVERNFTETAISGLFNEILKVAFEIHRTGRLPVEQDPGEVRATWQSAANPFQKFVGDEMQATKEPHLFEKGQLFRAFITWCDEHEINPRKVPGTITAFTMMIYGSGFTTTRRGKGDREWMYEGRYAWKKESRYSDVGGGVQLV
jgi:phage/plasmid-associated DNA primase